MAYGSITRTAPGWEERTAALLAVGIQAEEGAGPTLTLRRGFARLALLLEVSAFGGGSGLRVWVQHSPDGTRWYDLAAFAEVSGVEAQVAWVEGQPGLSGAVALLGEGTMAPGTVHEGFVFPRLRARWSPGGSVPHTFGVEVVAIYERGQ